MGNNGQGVRDIKNNFAGSSLGLDNKSEGS